MYLGILTFEIKMSIGSFDISSGRGGHKPLWVYQRLLILVTENMTQLQGETDASQSPFEWYRQHFPLMKTTHEQRFGVYSPLNFRRREKHAG